jgi:glycosyltransferase involved in cell wall biosynthesis
MFCSVIIPTIGRESLSRAVQSVLDQEAGPYEFELIVVNDSGKPLPVQPWQTNALVTILETNKRERRYARNSGAAVARGDYLWFLDDDDWLLPDAISSLKALHDDFPDASWLYGTVQVIDGSGKLIAEANSGHSGNCAAQAIGGAWFPIQASLIKTRTYFEVGGFQPHMRVTDDLDLCRRIALKGDFAGTSSPTGVILRGRNWATSTDYPRATEYSVRSRDEAVSENGAFRKMISSAKVPYWYGRIFRVYISTSIWNLRRGNLLTGMSRGFWGLASVAFAGFRLFSKDYWQGVRDHHVPGSLHEIMLEYERTGRGRETTPDTAGQRERSTS